MSEIITKINDTVCEHHMLTYGDSVVAGVSGGADSMLMLHYLLGLRDELHLDITVAHIEHGIRGERSREDSRFVEAYCKANAVKFFELRIDAPNEAKTAKRGVEEYSRDRRYAFFQSFGADKIAVAHNMSDNAETVLFRIARGTSIKGIAGIPAVRDDIIRPLIDCTHEEIRTACNELHIPYVTDETNSDNQYSRNYVRNVIIPSLRRMNPSAEKAIIRLAKSSAEDEAFIRECAKDCIKECSEKNGLNVSKLVEYHHSVIKRVIAILLSEYDVVADEKHLSLVLDALHHPRKEIIKENIYISTLGGTLRVYREQDSTIPYALHFQTVKSEYFSAHKEELNFDFYCDADKIVGTPYLRYRMEGDSIAPAGRGCTKTLKKLFNDLKVPQEKRSSIPIICDDSGIIAVYQIAISERVKTANDTKNFALFNITTEEQI